MPPFLYCGIITMSLKWESRRGFLWQIPEVIGTAWWMVQQVTTLRWYLENLENKQWMNRRRRSCNHHLIIVILYLNLTVLPFYTTQEWVGWSPFSLDHQFDADFDDFGGNQDSSWMMFTHISISGWWFGSLELVLFSHSVGNHHPSWLNHIFQSGGSTTNLCIHQLKS